MSLAITWFLIAATVFAQSSFVGTLVKADPGAARLEVRKESGEVVSVFVRLDTVVQRIAPGQRDLRNAEPAEAGSIAPGDRLLVSLARGDDARRIVVMPASAIAEAKERQRLEWLERGVSGTVSARDGNTIELKIRGRGDNRVVKVTASDATKVRRYVPDTVRFADAVPGSLDGVQIGDQLRAKGEKSSDGSAVVAEEIVFGSFVVNVGQVMGVDVERGLMKVKSSEDQRVLTVKISEHSELKALPQMGGAPGAMARMSPMGAGGPGAMPPSGPPDLSAMLERLPAISLDKVAVGETVVISSTKGAQPDSLTAIVLLTRADLLIQMAQMMQSGGGGPRGQGMPGGMGMGMGAASALGSLDFGGMVP
jgi:hypothetical protein